jgi:hypothetical protein
VVSEPTRPCNPEWERIRPEGFAKRWKRPFRRVEGEWLDDQDWSIDGVVFAGSITQANARDAIAQKRAERIRRIEAEARRKERALWGLY